MWLGHRCVCAAVCVCVCVCVGTTLSDRADEVVRLAGAVWIMSDIKSEAVLESRHYGA